jgi:hypothetical protein
MDAEVPSDIAMVATAVGRSAGSHGLDAAGAATALPNLTAAPADAGTITIAEFCNSMLDRRANL